MRCIIPGHGKAPRDVPQPALARARTHTAKRPALGRYPRPAAQYPAGRQTGRDPGRHRVERGGLGGAFLVAVSLPGTDLLPLPRWMRAVARGVGWRFIAARCRRPHSATITTDARVLPLPGSTVIGRRSISLGVMVQDILTQISGLPAYSCDPRAWRNHCDGATAAATSPIDDGLAEQLGEFDDRAIGTSRI